MYEFKPITIDSFEEIAPYLAYNTSRFSDFTLGYIYMWGEYMGLQYEIVDDCLYFCSIMEDNNKAVFYPLGKNVSLSNAISYVKGYSERLGAKVDLWDIPQSEVGSLDYEVTFDRQWSDYLYLYKDLASLVGHRFNKKRNRVNKFEREYNWRYEKLSEKNVEDARVVLRINRAIVSKNELLYYIELDRAESMLSDITCLPFAIGGILYVDSKPVAFSVGEVIGDTLFVHIEKALVEYDGAYEMINRCFCSCIDNPKVNFVNREDDANDLGLREAKLSYKPIELLNKYCIRGL